MSPANVNVLSRRVDVRSPPGCDEAVRVVVAALRGGYSPEEIRRHPGLQMLSGPAL
jgi:hypothetical protein